MVGINDKLSENNWVILMETSAEKKKKKKN